MGDFMTVSVPQRAPDRDKHVNYSEGMILGVDEFVQEFAYLDGHQHWLARETLGYGTLRGLTVSTQVDPSKGMMIVVTAGVGLTPCGELVCVDATQCAAINPWLDSKHDAVQTRLGSPPANEIDLFVVLCYHPCPTDNVPIPGEPCRTDDLAIAPSRIKDDFHLQLRLDSPDQREELALRDFVRWLRQIPTTAEITTSPPSSPLSPSSLADFAAAIRGAILGQTSPPSSPPEFMLDPPPADLLLPADHMSDYLRLAFMLWTTEVRPIWFGSNQPCNTPPEECCLLLARVTVPVQATSNNRWQVDLTQSPTVDTADRPALVHLRMLQEWLLQDRASALEPPTLAGDVVGDVATNEIERLQGKVVNAHTPNSGDVLQFDAVSDQWLPAPLSGGTTLTASDTVMPETNFDQASTAGTAVEYSRADHTHGTPPDPIPNHQADLNAHANHVVAGDVVGSLAATRVANIQARPVVDADPNPDDVLTWDGVTKQWEPRAHQAGNKNAVTHLLSISEYRIVAAGIVQCDGSKTDPVYNELEAKEVEDGTVLVRFRGYKNPIGQDFMYIVKVLAVLDRALMDRVGGIPVIAFREFVDEGFLLSVMSNNEFLQRERLQFLQLMIEISQYIV